MKPRIKLLLAIPHLGGGGAERVVATLARHLDPQRFEIHLALFTQDAPGAEPLPDSITVHRFGAARVRNAWLPLVRLIRAEHPHVILSGMAHLNFLLLLLKPFLPRRTVIFVRQNTTASFAITSPLSRFAYRYLYPRADKIVCQSQGMAEDLVNHFGLDREKLIVLANPVDIAAIRATCTASSVGNSESAPQLLCIGRLSPEKGVDLLLHALPAVRTAHPNLHLTVLGTGNAEEALRQLTIQLGIAETVTFAGFADPAAYYSTSTLFVLPSRYEGMPNALLEAAAAGLPLVATPCCAGVADLLSGNAPGTWLAPAITHQALAATIITALSELGNSATALPRFDHPFLAPFELKAAVAAYASLLDSSVEPGRLAMLIPTIDQIGGAERQVLLLAQELAARGWRVTLIALSGTGQDSAAALSSAKIDYLSLDMRKAWIDPRGWLRYLAWHRRHHPDIIHAHLPHASWFARWTRLLAPTRVLIDTIHTSKTSSSSGGPGRRIGYQTSNWLATQITCVSQSVLDSVSTANLAPRNKLKVIRNGVALPLPALAREPGSTFQWIAVGRLAPVKDYPTLLRAFAALPGQSRLQIVGTGPEEDSLRALAASLGIHARVHFAGFQANVLPLLRAADAFVLASLWEGLPVSILEASAAGLPVVATAAAGSNEAMISGETGHLVPIANPAALAEAMAQIMAMPTEQRLRMGARGRLFVKQNFSMSQIAGQWEQLYSQLLRDHPVPSRQGVSAAADVVTKPACVAATAQVESASASAGEISGQ